MTEMFYISHIPNVRLVQEIDMNVFVNEDTATFSLLFLSEEYFYIANRINK